MVNLVALMMIALGVILFLFGVFLLVKHKKMAGWVFSMLGLGLSAVPFLVSYYLTK
jgi:hypothetical protein